VPAGAEALASKWPAARPRRPAHPDRAERRDGRGATPGRQEALPADELISDLGDAEATLVERLDGAPFSDDVLRLPFICCHPELPTTRQIALALRIVADVTVDGTAEKAVALAMDVFGKLDLSSTTLAASSTSPWSR
jgi:predicted RNA polymerase sigma factor